MFVQAFLGALLAQATFVAGYMTWSSFKFRAMMKRMDEYRKNGNPPEILYPDGWTPCVHCKGRGGSLQ